jgi:hypothetical protein
MSLVNCLCNFPQVFGLCADIDHMNEKNPGPQRGIEKLIGPQTQKEIKTKGKDARNKTKFQGGLKPWQCQLTPTSRP